MQYGKEITTKTYYDGKPTEVTIIEERIKVLDDKQELSEYLRFTREIKPEDRVDFKYEHPEKKDYYYIIRCYRAVYN
jgi:hypothetical protein